MNAVAGAAGDPAPRLGCGRLAEAVDRIARKIAAQLDLAELARSVVEEVEEALEAEAAAVLLVDGAVQRFAAATGPAGPALVGTAVPLGQGICGEVARTGAAVLVADGNADPRIVRSVGETTGVPTSTMVAAPLVVHGRVIGVVEALNRRGRGASFGPEELAFLERLAPHVAAAVSNATFAAELRRSRDELARHAESLEQKIQERTATISAAKREWELTFDAIEDPIAIVERGVVQRANRAYARAAGLDVRAVPGKRCHEIRFGRASPCERCPIAAARPPDAAGVELETGRGTFVVRAFPMASLRPDAWVVSYHDVTEQRRLAKRLREAEHLSAIGRLAAGAAHEINNPMAFVTAALRSLREHVRGLGGIATLAGFAASLAASGRSDQALRALGGLEARAREVGLQGALAESLEILDEADEGARRVTDIVRALKVLGRDELGHDERFDLPAALERAAQRARRVGPFPGTLAWGRCEPCTGEGRPLQVDQALFEIVRNAGQAVGPDGTVELSSYPDAGWVVAEVRDDGVGVDPVDLPRVCEPFFTTRGVGGGVGLGLTIAYGVVQRHGGELEILRLPDRGTLVRMRLPAAGVAAVP